MPDFRHLKFPGAMLGPGAGQSAWGAPIAKWSARACSIAAASPLPRICAVLHGARALSTLSH
eukprot:6917728-Pyramimonas_sp.AAC.1